MEKHHFSRVKKVRGLNFIIAHREQFALHRIWAPGKPCQKFQYFVVTSICFSISGKSLITVTKTI